MSLNVQSDLWQLLLAGHYGLGFDLPCWYNQTGQGQEISASFKASRPISGPTHLVNGCSGLSLRRSSGLGVELTTHLHVVSRAETEWRYTAASTCVCFACIGTTLPLPRQYNQVVHSSSKANSRSAGQENSRLVRNRNIHCCVHKKLLLDAVLGQKNPLYLDIPCWSKIHCIFRSPYVPARGLFFVIYLMTLSVSWAVFCRWQDNGER